MPVFETLLLFILVFYVGSPVAYATTLGKICTYLLCFSTIKNLFKWIPFWILLVLFLASTTDRRLTFEYYLIASALFAFGFSKYWTIDKNVTARRNILFVVFILIYIFNQLGVSYSEPESLLLWFPVYLAIYFEKCSSKTLLLYTLSGIALFFSAKLTVFIAFIFAMRSKLVYFLSAIPLIIYFQFFQTQTLSRFYEVSILPRLYIWQAALNGFLEKPILGHGVGTFAVNFPSYRKQGDFFGGAPDSIISHGHNQLFHMGFEMGIVGVLLFFLLILIVYKQSRLATLPLLIICFLDAPMVSFNQYFIAGIILGPTIKDYCLSLRENGMTEAIHSY